jgi:transposase
MSWAGAGQDRKQLALFPRTLDDEIPADHVVRLLDQILQRVDWKPWEAVYHQRLGRPPIHPRILASVLLYGLVCRILPSRRLEEAVQMRIDFRWLTHDTSIDHSTLSKFRRTHPGPLRKLFVQIVMVGRELGMVTFQRIAFDGTRVRANNRRTGTRTPEQLRKEKQRLQEEFDRLSTQANAEDTQDEEDFGGGTADAPPTDEDRRQRQRDTSRAMDRVDAALAELDSIEQSRETTPGRLPITDPESRFTKNKDGGFAPNYTPTATVDMKSGLIVDETVIAQSNEAGELQASMQQVQQDYQLDKLPREVLADSLMATAENLRTCEQENVVLYSPVPGAHSGDNPAIRDNLRAPVPAEQMDRLPMRTVQIDGRKEKRFDKQAFVYDAATDVYLCPAGQELVYSSCYTTREYGRIVKRTRYRADKSVCGACPFAMKCLTGKSKFRQIDRGEHEDVIDRQRTRMASAAAQQVYATRRHAGERPFAVIKQHFGLRQFLTRGLQRVRQEWTWAAIAFNLQRLFGRVSGGVPP